MSDFKPDIWRLQAQFNTEGLLEALTHENPGIRKRAAAALRALGAYHTLPQLEAALEQETDPETRSNIVGAIATLQEEKERKESGSEPAPVTSKEVEHHIKSLKQATTPEQLIKTIQRLGELKHQSAVEPLLVVFNDVSKPVKVRLAVAEALLLLDGATGEVALLGALRSPNWRVRRNGVAVLGQLRASWAVDPLADALLDKHEIVRRTAFAALKNINTPDARKALDSLREAVLKRRQEQTGTQETSDAGPSNDNTMVDETSPETASETSSVAENETTTAESTETPSVEANNETSTENTTETSGDKALEDDTSTDEPEDESDVTGKLIWPKRKEVPQELLPTRPLDPSLLDDLDIDFGGGEDEE